MFLSSCPLSPPPRAGLVLADHGQSSYTIVIAPDASATVRHAAQESAADLKQISGVALPAVSQKPNSPAIFVGASPFLPSGFSQVRLDTLAEEAFVVRTDQRNIYLAGHDDRGTLYAVYSFLEDHLGARWYAPDATVLPPQDVVRIPDLNETQAPAFSYRDTDEAIVIRNGPWDAHLKLNGVSVPDQADLGGITGSSTERRTSTALSRPIAILPITPITSAWWAASGNLRRIPNSARAVREF